MKRQGSMQFPEAPGKVCGTKAPGLDMARIFCIISMENSISQRRFRWYFSLAELELASKHTKQHSRSRLFYFQYITSFWTWLGGPDLSRHIWKTMVMKKIELNVWNWHILSEITLIESTSFFSREGLQFHDDWSTSSCMVNPRLFFDFTPVKKAVIITRAN